MLSIYAWNLPGYILVGFGIYLVISYLTAILTIPQSEPFKVPPLLRLNGDEEVLDVGCGVGSVAIGIAKELTRGHVIGIDTWSEIEIPGNSPERAYENARLEGVADRVEFKTGNVLQIPFEEESFDLVTSGSVLNNLKGDEAKLRALGEIHRVLRPGGRFLLVERLRGMWGLFVFTLLGIWMLLTRDAWMEILGRTPFRDLEYQYYNRCGVFLLEKTK